MSEKKYIVPEDGLEEAWLGYLFEVLHKGPNYSKDTIPLDREGIEARKKSVKASLKAFIRLQDGKLEKMNRFMNTGTEAEKEIYRAGWEHGIDDVRRMYLAPEPEVPPTLEQRVSLLESKMSDIHPDLR
jgi:hypothetical protein